MVSDGTWKIKRAGVLQGIEGKIKTGIKEETEAAGEDED